MCWALSCQAERSQIQRVLVWCSSQTDCRELGEMPKLTSVVLALCAGPGGKPNPGQPRTFLQRYPKVSVSVERLVCDSVPSVGW
ncbi:Uncharacterized protein HZ326_28926 [Fusarium oxysporum f. sp. albedinis]|nr:Uncharacterized protein HZ326_28926 [Fusarium oxysporum f. sp. albedinis]